jgi:predicted transcriptional regulator
MAVKQRSYERSETAQARAYLVLAERMTPVPTKHISDALEWKDGKSLKALAALHERGLVRRTEVEVKEHVGRRFARRVEYRWEALL